MRLPPFSVILIFVVLTIAGASIAPLLNVQYTPTIKQSTLNVSFSWPGASARVIEAEATSKIEGAIASVTGVQNTKSVSSKERGIVTIFLKQGVKTEAVRYEIASLIRRLYPKLPEEITYPSISASTSGENQLPVLIYTVNAAMGTNKIDEYVQENILPAITRVDGAGSALISGATPEIIEISYSPEKLKLYSISTSQIISAINYFSGKKEVIGDHNGTTLLISSESSDKELMELPVGNAGGRIIRLGDVTSIKTKQDSPSYYYRVNGLNTVNFTIFPEKGTNTIVLCNQLKETMKELSHHFPQDFSAMLTYDASDFLYKELNKILRRTILSVLILLVFIAVTTKSPRCLTVILATLLANIAIAFIFYYLLKVEIHIYSLAGITVSLGMVIDSSIIMISHYGYFRDRKVFVAILAALLTTAGALSVIFFLPENSRMNLFDFSVVIIINLLVSLLIALFLIPALIDKFPLRGINSRMKVSGRRRVVKLNGIYERFILFGRRHRLFFIFILILSFGVPLNLLPEKIENKSDFWSKIYNHTFGSEFYRNNLKSPAEKILGGTIRLFSENMKGRNIYREPQRATLYIQASMPDGCTIVQLNEIMVYMENYLAQFEEIDIFKTQITSYKNGQIIVTFKEGVENSGFPLYLKNSVISKAIDFGGANWSVYGIDENGFSNNVGAGGYKSQRIVITGYNYDKLYGYALESVKKLSENIRVSEPGVFGEVGWGAALSRIEYFIGYDPERLALMGIGTTDTYYSLNREIGYLSAGTISKDGESRQVKLLSGNKRDFDVWNLENEHIEIGGRSVKFSELGSIEKRRTGNDIYKQDQVYYLTVAYDFIGPYELAKKVSTREIDRLNSSLPMGFSAKEDNLPGFYGSTDNYWILFIVIAIIFTIGAILFESLIQPIIIISLIPVAFVGLFLTFYITGYTFDQGGLAAMIMLSGISVNAGVYLINQYNILKRGERRFNNSVKCWLKAFNIKIIPILLTILSTTLGLIPFLSDGKNEVFWFAFAVGTMGGLLFSILGIFIFLPVFQKN